MASIKLIDKNGGIVSAFQDAQTRHFIKGNDFTGNTIGGVFAGIGNSFDYEINQSNKRFTIKDGIGLLYGRRFSISPGESVIFDLKNYTGDKKVSIYLVVDTRDSTSEKATIEMDIATVNFTSIDKGDNLSNKELGIARMLLYQFSYSSNSNTPIYSVLKKFYLLNPNVVEIAKKAMTLPGDSTINGRTVNTIVNSNKDSVKKADSSDTTLAINGNPINNSLAFTSIDNSKIIMIKHLRDNSTYSIAENSSETLFSQSVTNAKVIAVIIDFKLYGSTYGAFTWSNYKDKGYYHAFATYYELKHTGKIIAEFVEKVNDIEVSIVIENDYIKLKAITKSVRLRLEEVHISAIVEKA